MNCPSRNDWVISMLNDIATFLSANGMHDGAIAVENATAVVQKTDGFAATLEAPALLNTPPVTGGNIIRFSVYSRNRK
jgi:hypothetical protein